MTMLVFGLLLVVGVTLLVVTVVRVLVGGIARPSDRTATAQPRSAGPRQILDERYATGELSTEEYQHRLRVLEGKD